MGDNFKIFVNFKTYPQGTGEKAVELAQVCQEVQGEQEGQEGVEIIPIVQAIDLFRVKQEVDIPVWLQHLDWQPQGQFTGWINLEAVIEAGVRGTLLNHSEHQIPPGTIKQTISVIRNTQYEIRKFEMMVCCKTLGQMERLVKLKPDYIGYEISELIGGKISITDFKQKSITQAVKICGEIPLIVGAGVNQAKDIQKAKKLGAKGVLISSAVVLAKDPKEKLLEFIREN